MMTLLLFLLGIVIIYVMARYNESNKLFWSLLVAFCLSFAAGTLYVKCSNGENDKSGSELTQAYPIQGLAITSNTAECLLADVMSVATVKETSNPVGQVTTPDICEFCSTYSVQGVTHEQYHPTLSNPPNKTIMFDTS